MIYAYLKRRLLSLGVATACTLLLAFVSALTFAMLGPAVQILSNPQHLTEIPLAELFGQRLAPYLAYLLGRESFSVSQLWDLLPLVILTAAFLRGFLAMLQWFLWERSSELIARDMRQDLVERYLAIHPEARRESTITVDKEIAAGIGSDIRLVREYLVHFFGGFPREALQVLLYLITLFLLDPTLAAFFLLGLGPAGVLLSRLGKKMRKRSQHVLDNSSLMIEWLQQRLSGIETIKQFRTEFLEREQLNRYSEGLFNVFVKAARVKARTSPLLEVLAIAAMMVVLGYALQKIAGGTLNSSVLLSFFAVLANLSQSAAKLGRYFNSNKEGEAALERLDRLQTAMTEASQHLRTLELQPAQEHRLLVQNLSYVYRSQTKDKPGINKDQHKALEGLDLEFAKGRIYAIAGPSGSGKTTLLKLILGLWQLQTGRISYGIEKTEDLGYLPQTIQLMPGSIASNISYPDPEPDPERIQAALEQVGLLSLVRGLPESWNSEVGEGRSINLSGGQAQRIKLARLIYHRFPLIVIDEGTSALDPETEATVFRAFKEMAGTGATLIMVAHRLSALQIADELIVLRKGKISYRGSPSQILQSENWRELFDEGPGKL